MIKYDLTLLGRMHELVSCANIYQVMYCVNLQGAIVVLMGLIFT